MKVKNTVGTFMKKVERGHSLDDMYGIRMPGVWPNILDALSGTKKKSYTKTTLREDYRQGWIVDLESMGKQEGSTATQNFNKWYEKYWDLKYPFTSEANAWIHAKKDNMEFPEGSALWNMRSHANELATCFHDDGCWQKFVAFSEKKFG